MNNYSKSLIATDEPATNVFGYTSKLFLFSSFLFPNDSHATILRCAYRSFTNSCHHFPDANTCPPSIHSETQCNLSCICKLY